MSLPPLFRRPSEKLIGARRSALDVARGRLVLMGVGFAALYMLVAARALDLTVIQGELPRLAHQQVRDNDLSAPEQEIALRADIVDRNGVLLARSLETASLIADPALIMEPEIVAKDIVRVLPGATYGDVLKKLQRQDKEGRKLRSVLIRRNLTPNDQYNILLLGHPGLGFRQEERRIYPQGALTSHIVGFVNVDGKGLSGIERSMDSILAPGRQPLQTTIDIRLQHIVRRELQKAIDDFDAIGGIGAIMDVNTGEILAAVSAPDFDPHEIKESDKEAQFNRLTLGVYEMGSTFKTFSIAAYLEMKNASMAQSFDARAPISVGRFKISDFHPENRFLTIPEIFMVSSNIGAARMGEAVGTAALKDFYRDIGLLDKVQIELDEVSKPLVPNPWRDLDTMVASYGHSVAVTPIQTLAAMSTIANGGIVVHPTLLMNDSLPDKNGRKKDGKAEIRVISAQTAHRMRQLLRLVVTEGTAKSADVAGFQVGGKTGTADKKEGRGYDENKRLSSFIGVFPMDAPRYAVMVMVDEPKGNKASYGFATGGWVAAPAVGRIITAMVPVLKFLA
ncbi:MAG: penicillin-binding protein 2 [Micavibrio aeruginosavorus]|nr:penicillin-binding protein 2 [Micavibrio aeruginosavorus]